MGRHGPLKPWWANNHVREFLRVAQEQELPVIADFDMSLQMWGLAAGLVQPEIFGKLFVGTRLRECSAISEAARHRFRPPRHDGLSFSLEGGWPKLPPSSTSHRPSIMPHHLDVGNNLTIPVVPLDAVREHLAGKLQEIVTPTDPDARLGAIDAFFEKRKVIGQMAMLDQAERVLPGEPGPALHGGPLKHPWANAHLRAFLKATEAAGVRAILSLEASLEAQAYAAGARWRRPAMPALHLSRSDGLPWDFSQSEAMFRDTERLFRPKGWRGAWASFVVDDGWPTLPAPLAGANRVSDGTPRLIEPERLEIAPGFSIPVVSRPDLERYLEWKTFLTGAPSAVAPDRILEIGELRRKRYVLRRTNRAVAAKQQGGARGRTL